MLGNCTLREEQWQKDIRGVPVKGVEVGRTLDHVFLRLSKSRQKIAERGSQGRRVVAISPWATEPAHVEVVHTGHGFSISSRGGVRENPVGGVLERHRLGTLVHILVPLVNLGMSQESVVAAKEFGLEPAVADAVVRGEKSAVRVVGKAL